MVSKLELAGWNDFLRDMLVFRGVYCFSFTFLWKKSCNLEGDLTLESWTQPHRMLVASNPAIVAGAEKFLEGGGGDDGRSTNTPPTWWDAQNVCFHWYVYQRLPCQVFIMTMLNGTWNLASHSFQELPTEPIGIWHTMWPINVRKLTKNGTRFFSKHGGVGVVKMKMIVLVASLKSGSFEKSGLLRYSFGISGMASWHVYAGLIIWKNHRQLIVG